MIDKLTTIKKLAEKYINTKDYTQLGCGTEPVQCDIVMSVSMRKKINKIGKEILQIVES